ncbi:hypothetical protein [Rhodococcus opacus]|uniref:hypothetical protein n=1 Tax=Rhodococcus opacus TaxID=37919 RepID=UPI00155A4883|nr:hypothetical protein [Rhodococcus opacus]
MATRIRRLGRLVGTCAAAVAFTTASAGIASAVPDPVSVTTTAFQVPFTGVIGDPFPFATVSLAASTGANPGPGVVRLSATSMCPAFTPNANCTTYAFATTIRWLNLSTGVTGTATVPSGSFGVPGQEPVVDVPTGSGHVTATVLGASSGTIVPGLGYFFVP